MSAENKDKKPVEGKHEEDEVDKLTEAMKDVKLGDKEEKTESAFKPLSSNDIEGVAKYILDGHAKNIIVMTGAGISVSAGIPDFRSPGTGLYDNLEKYNLPYAEAVFDIDYFRENPKPFYEVVKGIYPGQFHPSKAHYFIRLLAEHGLLLRNFTQNIDTLELIAKIPQDKVIYAHGGFSKAHCVGCHKEYPTDFVREKVFSEGIVKCDKCNSCIKPDIVFFGESLPDEYFTCSKKDFPKCDLLIVMGTSLQVRPFATLINAVGDSVPRLLINMNAVGVKASFKSEGIPLKDMMFSGGFAFYDPDNHRDAFFKGTCDDGVQKLADALGWGEELKKAFEDPIPEFKFEH